MLAAWVGVEEASIFFECSRPGVGVEEASILATGAVSIKLFEVAFSQQHSQGVFPGRFSRDWDPAGTE